MFEEQTNVANSAAPANLPVEPVDILANLDGGQDAEAGLAVAPLPNALNSGLLRRKSPPTPAAPLSSDEQPEAMAGYTAKGPVLGKIIGIAVAIAVVAGLVFAGMRVYQKVRGNAEQPKAPPADAMIPPPVANSSVPPATDDTGASPVNSTGATNAKAKNDAILFGEQADSDNDGLDDAREREIGTGPKNPDTDGDGLADGQEVNVGKTNPLKADSDSDGLNDGDEVTIWHTDPLNPDTDGDGYVDGKEAHNGYNPLGPGKAVSANPAPAPINTRQ